MTRNGEIPEKLSRGNIIGAARLVDEISLRTGDQTERRGATLACPRTETPA